MATNDEFGGVLVEDAGPISPEEAPQYASDLQRYAIDLPQSIFAQMQGVLNDPAAAAASVAGQIQSPYQAATQAPIPSSALDLAAQNWQRGGMATAPVNVSTVDIGGTKIIPDPTTPMQIPRIQPPQEAGTMEKVAAGAFNTMAAIPNFFASPSGIALALAPELIPAKFLAPAVKGTFMGLMAKSAAEQAGTAMPTWDPRTWDPQGVTEAGGAAAMLGFISAAKLPKSAEALAGEIQKDFISRPERRAQIEEQLGQIEEQYGPRETFDEATGKPQPSRAPTTTERELLAEHEKLSAPPTLAPEEQAYLDTEMKALGDETPIQISDIMPEGEPFSPGHIATIDRANGRIVINPAEFSDWLKSISQPRRSEAVRAMLSEEGIHMRITDEDALAYHNSLSTAEQMINRRRYEGKGRWTQASGMFSDTQLGHEALRFQLQRAARLPIREYVEATLKDRIGLKTLTALEDIIRNVREGFTTATGEQSMTRQILDRVQANVEAAKVAAGGTPPAAFNKQAAKADEVLSVPLGGLDYRTIEGMDDAEAAKYFQKVGSPQKGAVMSGMKMSAEDVPQLEKLRDKAGEQMKAAITSNDNAKMLANFGKNIWYSAAIEGARREGPNFEALKRQQESQPAAYRKGAKDRGTPELLLPPMTPQERRATASEMGATGGMAATDIERRAYQGLWTGTEALEKAFRENPTGKASDLPRPSFSAFEEDMKRQGGPSKPGALFDVWQRAVYSRFMGASGSVLQAARKAFDLEKRFGTGPVADPPPTRRPLLESEVGTAEARQAAREEAQGSSTAQRTRGKLIGAIAEKLIAEAQTPAERVKILNREKVEPEDIGFGLKSKSPAWLPISGDLMKNPARLGAAITEDARVSGYPVSATRRLLVMRNQSTRGVEMVSTFLDGRRGPVALDPASPGREHVPLSTILKRFRPVYSILLDEPVQKFRQSFDSLTDFEDRFGSQARSASESAIVEPSTPEGELAPSTKTTGKVGVPGFYQDKPGVLEQGMESGREPVTAGEAGAILDHILAESGTFDSPDDVKTSLLALKEATNRQVLSGYRKLAQTIEAQNPQMTTQEVLEALSNQIYENHQTAKSYDQFVKSTMGQGIAKAGEAAPAQVGPSETARELTMLERRPPTDVRPENVPHGTIPERQPAPAVPEASLVPASSRGPAAYNKAAAQKDLAAVKLAIEAAIRRRTVMRDIPALLDGADRISDLAALNAASALRFESGDKPFIKGVRSAGAFQARQAERKHALMLRRAAKALVAVREVDQQTGNVTYNRKKLTDIVNASMGQGEAKARAWAVSRDPIERYWGQRWLTAIKTAREELAYADQHFTDADLRNVAIKLSKELHDAIQWENDNGSTTEERDAYYPGLHEGEFWSDSGINFGGSRLLGTGFRQPKKFANNYEALNAGPYIPASFDSADVLQHRVAQGARIVNRKLWADSLKAMMDPVSRKPVAREPDARYEYRDLVDKQGNKFQEITKVGEKSPHPDYELVDVGGGKKLAVRVGYKRLVHSITAKSEIGEMFFGYGKEAQIVGSALKHGVVLIFDTFHYGRLLQYAGAMMGRKAGYEGGFSALAYRESDLPRAVGLGFISQESADWASERIPINIGRGQARMQMSRSEVARYLASEGLNTIRLTDSLYKEAIQSLPIVGEPWHKIVGPYNRWLFDRFIPGLMTETAVRAFEARNTANPRLRMRQIARDIVRDTNAFYGSMGRQGVFKNATWRDLAQTVMLAPMWREGLIRKEAMMLSRVTGISRLLGRTQAETGDYLGVLGKGMGRGLLAYAFLTQAINLATRRQPTWKNLEEGHKLDAWIPTGKDTGFWLSPLSVFAEVTHDIIRYNETKPRFWDAILQVGANTLGPLGKTAKILTTGQSPTGEKYSTTLGVLKGAAAEMAPGPIGLSTFARQAGHLMLPDYIKPNAPGAMWRQVMASATGTKVQPGESAIQQIRLKADHYLRSQGIKVETDIIQPTDEPGYAKLRTAIRNDDPATGLKILTEIQKTKTDEQILKAMKNWERRAFTGSKKHETDFLMSLTPKELDIYDRAVNEKFDEWQKFLSLYMSQGQPTPTRSAAPTNQPARARPAAVDKFGGVRIE